MTTPTEATKPLSPDTLANQLFDYALVQYPTDPREAAKQVIIFLTESLVYAISVTNADDATRKAVLKSVGETIVNAPPLPGKGVASAPTAPVKR